jgi:major vault protein
MDEGRREKDLVLRSNEYAYISDNTKGMISCYTGPFKSSLSATDTPVVFDGKKFVEAGLEESKQLFAVAPEGWYIQLKNPAIEDKKPNRGNANIVPDLQIGHKINIPGPISFALWPGQTVKVLKGHHLRSNQYLVVRVYDEEAAKANWKNAVMKTKEGENPEEKSAEVKPEDLIMGAHLIIRGTDVSFYIPPTGIEVVPDMDAESDEFFVRDAVTLETLEYCILLDEDGNKRYIQGPAVVFPEPTETFVAKEGSRKYKALELNENSGIYVRVIEDYTDGEGEGAVAHKKGDELFITGKETAIYYPRPEHAIVRYGELSLSISPFMSDRYSLYTAVSLSPSINDSIKAFIEVRGVFNSWDTSLMNLLHNQ